MSEYIVCVDDLEESYYKYTDIKPKTVFEHLLREEIVRCRDCIYHEHWEYYDSKPDRDICGIYYCIDVSLNDFCSSGERKQ